MIKISVYYEDKLVTEFEQADEKDVSVGRAAGCAIQLDEASISRLHAVIRYDQGSWVLERRASFGAVLLNGNEVENAPLEGGEEISIGKFNLRINLEQEVVSQSEPSRTGDSGLYQEDDSGRTRVVEAGISATFRFEPGTANVSDFVLDKDVAVFGRGSNCDVVLTEKKASRKHCEVRRQGLSFFVKDLNSSNGVLVNGVQISEQELVPGDVIQIGECQIQFIVENKQYFSQQDQFMPVPSHLSQQMQELPQYNAPDLGQVHGLGMDPVFGASPDSAPGIPTEPPLSPTDYIGRAKRAWSKIPRPQRMRYLSILVVFALVTALLGGPDEAPKEPVRPVGGSKTRTYEQLTPQKKKFVRDHYGQLITAQEKKDFTKMLEHTGHILTYVDEYKDTLTYERLAKKRLEEIEEERRRAEAERRQEEIRQAVKALEEKGKPIYEKALNEQRFRVELDSVIQEIYSKDPNNRLAQEWKEGIRSKDQKDRDEAEAARIFEEKKAAAEEQLAAVRRTYESEKYVQALAEAEKLADVDWSEGDYRERIDALKEEIRSKLSSIIDPRLREANSQRGEGGDLVKANQLYGEVLKVDPNNREAVNGMSAIKEVLHLRAKRFYAEAILAESVSDLPEAKDKFEKCFRTAPETDSYKRRCRNKLARFEYFNSNAGF